MKPSISILEGFTFSALASAGSYTGFFVKVLESFLIKLPSKEAFIKEPLQSVEVVKPSISSLLCKGLMKLPSKGAFIKEPLQSVELVK